ncbi:MAG: magnesium transporter [Gammaproteobacteria bacterium]|nr:magnesium transporter [Gammaproteobacteria bacterium]MCP5202477.1 magnesium transporter [Gammaproteobacteria bacterium]
MSEVLQDATEALPDAAAMLADPAAAALALELLPVEQAARLLAATPVATTRQVWQRLSPATVQQYLHELPLAAQAEVLAALEPNRSASLLALFDEEVRTSLVEALPAEARRHVEQIMSYPPDSAGALMDPRVIFLRRTTSVGAAIDRVRQLAVDPGRGGARRMFYLVDGEARLEGVVELQDLVLARPQDHLERYARPVEVWAEVGTTKEQVVAMIEQYGLSSLPVLDAAGRLVGVLKHETLVAATRAEVSADLQTIFGASKEEGALSSAGFAVRKRLPWLQINLVTAFVAASVVGAFEDTIARNTALAVLLPVVAGQSGNTGAQALAVVIRALALHEITAVHWRQVVAKELLTGLANGCAVAATTAAGVWVWSRSAVLALIIGLSMVLSMVIAGLSGAIIPILLTRLRQDPAQSSSIVLTTVTDVTGFLSFLGIATLLLGVT